MKIFHNLLDLLFPPKCVLCEKILEKQESDLCRCCRTEISDCPKPKRIIPFIESWLCLWYYEGTVRQSLLRYKFGGHRSHATVYGRLLAMKLLREVPDGFDILTYTPISTLRQLSRGYDQVELVAKATAAELGMEVTPTLKKIRHNPPQSGISGAAHRRANVLGAYQAIHPERFAGKRVLLLDDIVTTGSTVSECARVLLTAGAKEVICAAIAGANQQKTPSNNNQ
jgi:ComF family protein